MATLLSGDLPATCAAFEAILNALPTAVTLTDKAGILLFENKAAKLCGASGVNTDYAVVVEKEICDRQFQLVLRDSISPLENPSVRFLVDNTPQTVELCLSDGTVEYASSPSPSTSRDNCGGAGAIVPPPNSTAIHPEDAEQLAKWQADAHAGAALGYPLEYRVKDVGGGSIRWHLSNASPLRNEYGVVVRWLRCATDITKQRVMYDAAEEGRVVLSEALQHLPVGVVVAEPPEKVVFMNDKCKEWFCPSPRGNNNNTQHLSDCDKWLGYHADGRQLQADEWPIARTLKTGEAVRGEVVSYKRADQTMGVVRFSSLPVYSPGTTNLIAAVASCEDITERMYADEQTARVIAAERAAEATAELLANVSHELRTPLNAVIGMSDLLDGSGTLNEEQHEYVHTIRESGKLLLTVIDDVLDHEKLRNGKMVLQEEPFSPKDIVKTIMTVMSHLANRAGVSLTSSLNKVASGDLLLRGDAQRITQVLLNFVSNAVRFTPETGSVFINVEATLDHPSPVEAKNVHIMFEVIDTGVGMAPQAVARVFAPFMQADSSTTRRFGGTGLGLAICRYLIELMHGKIDVQSEVDRGSRFWVELDLPIVRYSEEGEHTTIAALPSPLPSAAAPALQVVVKDAAIANLKITSPLNREEEPVSVVASERMPKILVAEDNPVNQLLVRKFLRNAKFTDVTVVSDGDQALQQVMLGSYDIVLMDCQMPVMDGYEATRRIRQLPDARKAHIPIIALTANALPADVAKSMEAGMSAHVSKPYSAKTLIQTMQQLLTDA